MPKSILQRLRDVFALEEKNEWLANAITGGFRAFQELWEADALRDGLDDSWVRQISERIQRYESATRHERQQLAAQIMRLLDRPGQPDPALSNIDKGASAPPTARVSEDAPAIPPPGPTPPSPRRPRRQPNTYTGNPLGAPIETVSGIGPATAELLGRLGIVTVEDLIWHLPTRHDDYSEQRSIADVRPGEKLSIVANLWKVETRKVGFKRSLIQGIFNDGTGTLRASWWNQPWKVNELVEGKTYRLMGKVDLYMGQKTLTSPQMEPIRAKSLGKGSILPIYRLTEGFKRSDRLNGMILKALQEALPFLVDPLPTALRQHYNLLDLPTALSEIHHPESRESLNQACKRLAFDELFYIQMGVQQRRHLLQRSTAPALVNAEPALAAFVQALPFQLTGAQRRVLDEVTRDLARTVPMSRLIQGDVGSGKTAVAAAAIFLAVQNGAQSALLAPTQILAEQHYRSLSALLGQLTRPDGTPLRVELLTGARHRRGPRSRVGRARRWLD